MKVCFPVDADRGLDSLVCEHFGQAPGFVLVDTETMEVTSVQNSPHDGRDHGQCAPVGLLAGTPMDVLVVGGIGRGAIMKLNAQGTSVYRAAAATVRDNVELIRTGRLEVLGLDAGCAGHH
jgi:predicted Fe-Mo cluster-binding NifX family protein